MRIIGIDIHCTFAEAVVMEYGTARRLGRVNMTRESLQAFPARLLPTDHMFVDVIGKAAALVDIRAPKVTRVVVASPLQVHLIVLAKAMTDKINARVLAQLYASEVLLEDWFPG